MTAFVVTRIGDIALLDRKSTRLNSSHGYISYAVFCLKKKKKTTLFARASTPSRRTQTASREERTRRAHRYGLLGLLRARLRGSGTPERHRLAHTPSTP